MSPRFFRFSRPAASLRRVYPSLLSLATLPHFGLCGRLVVGLPRRPFPSSAHLTAPPTGGLRGDALSLFEVNFYGTGSATMHRAARAAAAASSAVPGVVSAHKRITSAVSILLPLASRPSGSAASAPTYPMCPSSTATQAHAATSHTRTYLSTLPLASRPLGSAARDATPPVCPSSTASHTPPSTAQM